MSKKNDAPPPFNNAFGALKALKKEDPKPKGKSVPQSMLPPLPPRRKSTEEEESALFLESVGEVAPVRVKIERVGPPVPPTADQIRIPTEEAESLARLAELVSGEGEFNVSDSDAFIEGSVVGFDVRVMKKLRGGDFSTQANIDLHGLTREEAKPAIEAFIQKARIAGHRCVLVVTGRGLHSKDSVPVIKQSVQAWLTRGKAAKHVLAFCTAAQRDGGAGAVYVLLRR